jgi:hypothetical protein
MAFNKDTLLMSVLAASGAKQTVIYDDKGKPSFMTRIPRFNVEDISADLGNGVHPAFVVNGVVKNELYLGTYQAVIDEGRACSIPGQSPKVNINYDDGKAACVAKGPGWHLMTAWEWAAVGLWCLKNGSQPRGNTNYLKSHEAGYETGTPAPDNATAKTLGGSGPASWQHDGTYQGIADLVGNVWEWNDGLCLKDGRLYFPVDNNFTLPEGSWPASPVYIDASAGPGDRNGASDSGDPILSNAISKYSETPTPAGGSDTGDFDYAYIGGESGWRSMAISAGYDTLALSVRQQMAQLLIAPKLTGGGTTLFNTIKGGIWVRNYGLRFPLRGGAWAHGADAGLGALLLSHPRAHLNTNVGFRPAFIL